MIFSLALVCILRPMFEQLVNSRAVTMLRYTRCNIVILMAATAWLMLSFSSASCADLIRIPYFSLEHLESTVYESNPHLIQTEGHQPRSCSHQNHYVTSVYLNTIRSAQLCVDAGGNHFQFLLLRYVLSTLGDCINFCIYTMLRTRATFSWRILYFGSKRKT